MYSIKFVIKVIVYEGVKSKIMQVNFDTKYSKVYSGIDCSFTSTNNS